MGLENRVAIVTGGAQGIGRGCAIELARAGAAIVINDRPGSETLSETVHAIEELGVACRGIEADIFSRDGCAAVCQEALEAFGRIDILISNPAYSRRGDFLSYPPEEFERTLQGTLSSGFHMSQLVARHMVERREGGRIVFISSVHAVMPLAMASAYNAAKAGLNHLMRTVAVELLPHRITVNAIEPGWIDTPGERSAFSEEVIQQAGRELPWGRLGNPSEIGSAAAFLASDQADYITGITLPVDGGFRFKDCQSASLPTLRNDSSEIG